MCVNVSFYCGAKGRILISKKNVSKSKIVLLFNFEKLYYLLDNLWIRLFSVIIALYNNIVFNFRRATNSNR